MSFWLDDSGDADSRLAPPRIATGPRTGFAENFAAAAAATGKADLTVSRAGNLRDAYAPLIEELNRGWRAEGRRPLVNPYGHSAADPPHADAARLRRKEEDLVDAVWAEIGRRRAADPGALAGLPASRAELEKAVRADAVAAVEHAAGVGARATTGGAVGGFAGGLGRAMTDPPNVLSLPFGASASWGILRTAVAEGLINAGVEAALQPAIGSYRRELGLGYGPEDFVRNVGFALGGGFLLGGTVKGGSVAVGRIVETRRMNRDQLLAEARKIRSPSSETRGALLGAERELEADAQIPVADPSPAARGEHRSRLNTAAAAAADGRLAELTERPAYDLEARSRMAPEDAPELPTFADYMAARYGEGWEVVPGPRPPRATEGRAITRRQFKKALARHRAAVLKALERGEQVPEAVLAVHARDAALMARAAEAGAALAAAAAPPAKGVRTPAAIAADYVEAVRALEERPRKPVSDYELVLGRDDAPALVDRNPDADRDALIDRMMALAQEFRAVVGVARAGMTLRAALDRAGLSGAGPRAGTAAPPRPVSRATAPAPPAEAAGQARAGAAQPESAARAADPASELEPFAEPAGGGQAAQAEFLEAELRREIAAGADLDAMEVPAGARLDDETGALVAETRTARQLLDEHEADAGFLDAVETICGTGGGAA